MTSIERTAYPRFSKRQQFSQQWLYNTFTLQDSDHEILQRKRTINDTYKLCMAIQLKTFQYLGYFIDLKDVPGAVVKTIRDSLGFPSTVKAVYHHNRTKYRHRNYIRSKLAIVKWKSMPYDQHKGTRRLAIEFAYNISTTMNNPADIINATLEFMVSNKYELPAFSTIVRLVKHVRHIVNTKIYTEIYAKLQSQFIIPTLSGLMTETPGYNRTGFNALKKLPKQPTVSNLRDLIKHHDWLFSLGNISSPLSNIAETKLNQFAEYTISLDASDIREMNDAKKYSLITILIHHARHEIKDGLATTFCKTIFKILADAKRELERLKEKYTITTQAVADLLTKITEDIGVMMVISIRN